jgi:hypothetical protein
MNARDAEAPPITLERCAEVTAHLRFFKTEAAEAVLAALGIDAERWETEGGAWLTKIADEAEAGEGDTPLGAAFGDAYQTTIERLRRERPRLQQLGSTADEPAASSRVEAPAFRVPGLAPTEMSASQLSLEAAASVAPPAAAHARAAEVNLDATIEAVGTLQEPALPFGAVRSAEYLAKLARPARPAAVDSRDPADALGSTVEVRIDTIGAAATPFASAQPPVVEPDLTLERYAELRAHLMVAGEDDPETCRRFGCASKAAKDAIQERFAALFRSDPAARERFVELLSAARAALGAAVPAPVVRDTRSEDDLDGTG